MVEGIGVRSKSRVCCGKKGRKRGRIREGRKKIYIGEKKEKLYVGEKGKIICGRERKK